MLLKRDKGLSECTKLGTELCLLLSNLKALQVQKEQNCLQLKLQRFGTITWNSRTWLDHMEFCEQSENIEIWSGHPSKYS